MRRAAIWAEYYIGCSKIRYNVPFDKIVIVTYYCKDNIVKNIE